MLATIDWGQILTATLVVVVPILGGVVTTFLVALIRKYMQKMGVELTAKQEESLKKLAEQGVAWVEARAKAGLTNNSNEKLKLATDYVSKQLEMSGLEFNKDRVEASIEKAVADLINGHGVIKSKPEVLNG